MKSDVGIMKNVSDTANQLRHRSRNANRTDRPGQRNNEKFEKRLKFANL